MNNDNDSDGAVDLTGAAIGEARVEASVDLPAGQARLRVKLPPGEAGRAEAVFGRQSWAAKHYWNEDGGVTVYEFDEPLPQGSVLLRIPLRPRS
jgi:hypothetical protein